MGDFWNKVREAQWLFDQGGIAAVLSGNPRPPRKWSVRRSVAVAAWRLWKQHPGEDLQRIIRAHEEALGDHRYNREAKKFWAHVRWYVDARTVTPSDGTVFEFVMKDDTGKGWPPFEKPELLRNDNSEFPVLTSQALLEGPSSQKRLSSEEDNQPRRRLLGK